MQGKTRLFYFIATLAVVLIGILSRNISGVPLFFGDVFYSVMAYFGCRMIFIRAANPNKIILPLLFCYLIELQQLCDAYWLLKIRHTTLGHYALGQGFLWSDILCYTIGIFTAFWFDFKVLNRK
ncbi:MAG: DUF2809 domain-containing protein [Flavobacterium sp.]